jgi:hypothetical protein
MTVNRDQDQVGRSSGPDWINLFRVRYGALETKFTPDECYDLLEAERASNLKQGLFYVCSRPLAGTVGRDGFDLQRCVVYNNAYRPWAKGKVTSLNDQTVVSYRIAVYFVAEVLALLGFSIWLAVLGGLGGLGLSGAGLFPVLAAAFAIWLGSVAYRLYLARNDPDFLVQFLTRTLRAHEVATPTVDGATPLDARQLWSRLPGYHPPAWVRLIRILAVSMVVIYVVWFVSGIMQNCKPPEGC